MKSLAAVKEDKTISRKPKSGKRSLIQQIWYKRGLFLLFLPGFLLLFLFRYGPMYGIILAFKDYNLGLGIWGSPWVGFEHFIEFFTNRSVNIILENTIVISLLKLLFGFPAPILLAIMLNEIKDGAFKKVVQTITYLPHFLSWVIIAGIITNVLSPSTGIVNHILQTLGMKPIYFLISKEWFRVVLVLSSIWKEVGWGAVIYLAAICGIEAQLYEAAIIDGASRFQRIRHITLPSLSTTISILLLMRVGYIMDAGFDQVFNLYNPSVFDTADIIDTYVYRVGLQQFKYSFNTAIGLFKSVAGVIMITVVNFFIRKLGSTEHGIW